MKHRDGARMCPQCGHRFFVAGSSRCPECGHDMATPGVPPARPRFLSIPEMRYQDAYVWLVLVSFLDIVLTWLVLYVWSGQEVNPIAAAVIEHWGFTWTIIFKFATVVFVVIICEVIGRRKDRTGRALAIAAVVINALPVAFTFALLLGADPILHDTPGENA